MSTDRAFCYAPAGLRERDLGIVDLSGSFKDVKLDPRRTRAARLAFDQKRKYDAWRKLRQASGEARDAPTSRLAAEGFEVVMLITPDEAAWTKTEIAEARLIRE